MRRVAIRFETSAEGGVRYDFKTKSRPQWISAVDRNQDEVREAVPSREVNKPVEQDTRSTVAAGMVLNDHVVDKKAFWRTRKGSQ